MCLPDYVAEAKKQVKLKYLFCWWCATTRLPLDKEGRKKYMYKGDLYKSCELCNGPLRMFTDDSGYPLSGFNRYVKWMEIMWHVAH